MGGIHEGHVFEYDLILLIMLIRVYWAVCQKIIKVN
jgi:hypothetical protein